MLVVNLVNHPLSWLILIALIVVIGGAETIEAASLEPRKSVITITLIAYSFIVSAFWGFIFSTHWQWLEAMASWTFF